MVVNVGCRKTLEELERVLLKLMDKYGYYYITSHECDVHGMRESCDEYLAVKREISSYERELDRILRDLDRCIQGSAR